MKSALLILGSLLLPLVAWAQGSSTIEDVRKAMIGVDVKGQLYTGVVIGDVARLRYALTVVNTCEFPRLGDLGDVVILHEGEIRGDQSPRAKVLSFNEETGLTLVAFLTKRSAPPRVRTIADVPGPKHSLTVLSLVRNSSDSDVVYQERGTLQVNHDRTVIFGSHVDLSTDAGSPRTLRHRKTINE